MTDQELTTLEHRLMNGDGYPDAVPALVAEVRKLRAVMTDALGALTDSSALLSAMLLETRPESEIDRQLAVNRAVLSKAGA